ncbi:MAG TPA: acyl-CoA dehydrogenase family protein [Vicinamibacterales bacterium]|jgi:alkylation response protein AidB-like acyl-CoA dehydrogenase|nr:acyl-CoA dehydrogenase family protein [Vicinamibacterales bacterium]
MPQAFADYSTALEKVCTETVAPEAPNIDHQGAFPERSIKALAATGLMGAVSAPEVGGLGAGFRGASAIVRRLAQDCGSTAMVVCMHYCGTAVIEAYGPRETRQAAATGSHLSTLAFSEAGSRSHFWVPVSTAQRAGDSIVLDAKKSWVTSASKATGYIWSSQPVQTNGGLSTIWLVDANSPGLTVQGPFNGLGLRGNDSSPVSANGVRVPESAMLGDDGKGFDIMMGTVLPLFNVLNAACSIGIMEAAVQRTAQHASVVRFAETNATLADLPTIRSYIARMRVKTDMARTLADDAIAALETGRADAMLRVLSCKAAAGEAATEVLELAMRVCGGAAFRKDVAVERYFRDAHAAGVMGPTTDVLYDFIGKAVCGMPLF